MTMLRSAAAVGLFCLTPFAGAAAQQTVNIQAFQRPAVDPSASPIRVQVNVNFFVPGPANESEQSSALGDQSRRLIYEMAARECDLLRDKLAEDCRIESLNVNINRQLQRLTGQQVEGFQVGGVLAFRITPKAPVSP